RIRRTRRRPAAATRPGQAQSLTRHRTGPPARPHDQTQDLADKLNAAGLTTGHGRPFDIAAVQWIRHAYRIPAPNPYTNGEISVADAARRLSSSTGVFAVAVATRWTVDRLNCRVAAAG
ncbi:MAG: hypothetical protein LC644_12885, partial [Pseudonocardia sp.]|nr:hypothetical protein [Pseudonocardia sp.]